MDALTAYSYRARTPAEAAEAVRSAFEAFATGRPRPVHVDVPVDVLEADGPAEATAPRGRGLARSTPRRPRRRWPRRAAAGAHPRRRGARRGRRAGCNVPVVTTVNGKGIVDERDPLSLGASIRLRAASVVARRARPRDRGRHRARGLGPLGPAARAGGSWCGSTSTRASCTRTWPPTHRRGDAATALAQLEPWGGARRGPDRRAIRDPRGGAADGAPFLELVQALDEALGPDGSSRRDSTMPAYYGAVHFLPMAARRRFIYPTGYATLGYALPAAIGAKLAAPRAAGDRPRGDGGLLFTVAEPDRRRARAPAAVVVANNRGYGEIRDQMVAGGSTDRRRPARARPSGAGPGPSAVRGSRWTRAELAVGAGRGAAAPGPTCSEILAAIGVGSP